MAGDWIQMEKATASKPEVLRIASILGCSHGDAFLHCFRFWCWCDEQLTDGNAVGVTEVMLDALLGCAGLCAALVKVGWLHVRDGALVVPNFDRHLSESAKRRALSGKRQAAYRSRKSNDASVTKTSPEKRREEKSVYVVNESSDSFSLRNEDMGPERAQSGKRSRKRRRSSFDPTQILLPAVLGSDAAFCSAWLDWCRYRVSKSKPISELAAEQQIASLSEVGPVAAIEAIRKAISNDWQGLFPDRSRGRQSGVMEWVEKQGDLE